MDLRALYHRVYETLCGRHPHLRPWHFQWLTGHHLYPELRRWLPTLRGRILDVGCRDKPYQRWATEASEYLGVDVVAGPKVDWVIEDGKPWPLPSESFDGVVCTQVLQHVRDLSNTLGEIERVLKPGGRLLMTVPFAYSLHGVIPDYWRMSRAGVVGLLGAGYEVEELQGLGGVGSTIAAFALNWIEVETGKHALTRVARGLLLPIWLLICLGTNLWAWALNIMDTTHSFYSNVLILARKR